MYVSILLLYYPCIFLNVSSYWNTWSSFSCSRYLDVCLLMHILPSKLGDVLLWNPESCWWKYGENTRDIFSVIDVVISVPSITDILFSTRAQIVLTDGHSQKKYFKKSLSLQYLHTMTSSNGNLFHVTGHLRGEFTGHKCQWRGTSIFSLVCA